MALSLDPGPVFIRGRVYQGLVVAAIRPREIVHQTRQVAEHLKRLEFAPLCDVGSFMRIPGSVRLQQGDAFFEMSGRLAQCIDGSRTARRIEQALRCTSGVPGLGMVMCQPFWLMRNDFGKARFNDVSDASVQLTAPGLRERLISGLLNERVTKHMDLRRRQAGTIDQLVVR